MNTMSMVLETLRLRMKPNCIRPIRQMTYCQISYIARKYGTKSKDYEENTLFKQTCIAKHVYSCRLEGTCTCNIHVVPVLHVPVNSAFQSKLVNVTRTFYTCTRNPKAADTSSEENTEDDDIFLEEGHEEIKAIMKEFYSIPGAGHKVFVIQPENIHSDTKTTPELQLEESCALIQTLPNWEVVDTIRVPIKHFQKENIFSQVKLDSLSKMIHNLPISAVFISLNNLSHGQIIYLQQKWDLPVLDRYAVVLQIFKDHACTKEAKLQVAMAEIGFLEQSLIDISTERDINISDNFAIAGSMPVQSRLKLLSMRKKKLNKALTKVKKQRILARKNRQQKSLPVIAVVGYTNCGKTTLIKALTGDQDMEPKNQLFATLDVTAHGGKLKGSMKCIFMDTVGFIADIPIRLVDAFNATLEDAMIADVILHVCDVSHPDREAQEHNVDQKLTSLLGKEQQKKIIKVGNKADKLVVSGLQKTFLGLPLISAQTGQGLLVLQEKLYDLLLQNTNVMEKKVKIPMDGDHFRWLKRYATVDGVQISEDCQHFIVDIVITQNNYQKFKNLFGKPKITKRKIH